MRAHPSVPFLTVNVHANIICVCFSVAAPLCVCVQTSYYAPAHVNMSLFLILCVCRHV